MPAGQGWQTSRIVPMACSTGLKKPASQGMHTACALRLDVPLAQGRHCHEVASFAKEPPSHAVQLVAPLLLSVANPNGQSMHRSESGIGPYRPSSHFTPDNHINKVFIVIVWGR